MARKKELQRKIDQKTTFTGAPLPLIQEDEPAPPAFYNIPAPDTLVEVAQAIQRSTQASLVSVALSWQEAPNIAPDYYNVEWDLSSSFTNVERKRASQTSATIEGLKANGVTYYFRVQAVMGGIYSAFSDSLTVVTMTDDTPPPEVTSLAGTFVNGDLHITWVKPVSEIYKDVEIKIYNAGHTILYATLYSASTQIIWTAAQNLAATTQLGVTSVYIAARSRSWYNYFSTGINTTATSTAPDTPTPTWNWTGDTGVVIADLSGNWTSDSNANDYILVLDGIQYQTRNTWFTYTYNQNVANHTPTLASGDPNITAVLYARNKLNQTSVPASGTISNAAPPSNIMSLSVAGGFSTIAATVAILGAVVVHDFDHFEWALASGSTIYQRFNSPDTTVIFQTTQAGSYQPTVRMVDKFNQKSATLSGAITVVDALTIAELRAETTYTDSTGASSPALDIFKDGEVLLGKTYSSVASGTYQWIEAKRPFLDRHRTTTFNAVYTGGATLGYLEYNDGTTSTYYSGPVTTAAIGTKILTKYTTETTAKTNRIRLDLLDSTRIDLPNLQEARTIRIYFSNYLGNLAVYEYYPRRLVQTDDLEAETITSINIAAGGVNADRITAVTLSAIQANIGALVINTTGSLWQGTGTAASPTTGLKIFNSGGVGKLSTYNTGVEQVTLDTDGKLKAGAGNVILDATGIRLAARTVDVYSALPTVANILAWTASSNVIGSIESFIDNSDGTTRRMITLVENSAATSRGKITISPGNITLKADVSSTTSLIDIFGNSNGIDYKSAGNHDFFDSASTVQLTVNTGGVSVDTIDATTGHYNRGSTTFYSGNVYSVANNGVQALPITGFAFLFIHAGGIPGIYSINGSSHTTGEINDASAIYTPTAGTASSINIYWSAGNARYELENKRGSTLNIRLWWMESS